MSLRRPVAPPSADPAVPPTPLARPAARRVGVPLAARRRRAWRTRWSRRIGVGVALAATVGGTTWVLLASTWADVDTVAVTGTSRVDAGAVQASLDDLLGTPLVAVDAGTVAERVSRVPLVAGVDVVRVWPATLEVRVRERVPVAAVPARGGVELVDADGVVVATQSSAPGDLPLVEVDVRRAGADSLAATIEVLAAVPPAVREAVARIGARSPDEVVWWQGGGQQVVWGSAAESARKAEVLQALWIAAPAATVYDVSAPAAPVTR